MRTQHYGKTARAQQYLFSWFKNKHFLKLKTVLALIQILYVLLIKKLNNYLEVHWPTVVGKMSSTSSEALAPSISWQSGRPTIFSLTESPVLGASLSSGIPSLMSDMGSGGGMELSPMLVSYMLLFLLFPLCRFPGFNFFNLFLTLWQITFLLGASILRFKNVRD